MTENPRSHAQATPLHNEDEAMRLFSEVVDVNPKDKVEAACQTSKALAATLLMYGDKMSPYWRQTLLATAIFRGNGDVGEILKAAHPKDTARVMPMVEALWNGVVESHSKNSGGACASA